VSNSAITAASTGVAVTSGRVTQNSASLAAADLSIDGYNRDGVQTTLTMRVADRQGNPVPAGAQVNFVASHGLVQGTCTIDAASQCAVTYTSQGTRPDNGRVAILAYMDGEESFIDLNGDNIWQPGEPFYDVGLLYRDDNENSLYDAASEQTYPGGMSGSSGCTSTSVFTPWVANTCDGTWSSSIRVRQQAVIALAVTNRPAKIVLTSAKTAKGFTVVITDFLGNGLPNGSTVAAAVGTSGAACKVNSITPPQVVNSPDGSTHVIKLNEATDCLTSTTDVTVTTPRGTPFSAGF
jgi:hypothetical protein